MLSSSVGMDPELAPPPSARIPDPGCAADEVILVLPLLLLSSSVLLPPLTESLTFRCPKLLLYLANGAGFGELDKDDVAAWPGPIGELREGIEGGGPMVDGLRASVRAPNADAFPTDPRGAEAVGCSVCRGDADSEGVLKGMTASDGLRAILGLGAPSADRRDDRDPCADRLMDGGLGDCRSVGDCEPLSRAALRAERGLELAGGPT